MNRKIYTYTDLHDLGNCSFWNEIKKYPQVTVSSDMRKSLKGSIERDLIDGVFKDDQMVQACEMRKLSDAILPNWTDDETKFHQTVTLSRYIRERIAKCGEDFAMRRWLIGCRRNISALLSAIVMLEEANIHAEDILPGGDRNVELMLEAWEYLRKNNPSIESFRSQMRKMERRNSWDPVFNKVYGKSDIQTLVFHGFYYFTPLQEWFIKSLEKAGIRIICLFQYDEKYPYANEIWRKTYSVENGYSPLSDWTKEKSEEMDPYGEIFEGRRCNISNRLRIQEYASVMEFVHEIKHAKEEGYFIYSSNHRTANEILRDFYPEQYGERKILSYPIGQFVSSLNKMWDEDLQEIILDEDLLIECFSSGWLAIDGISGKQYMQDLMNVMPFFRDCMRVVDWEARLDFLKQIEEDVIEPFRANLDVDDSVARWQEIMGNPFLNFSIFAVAPEKLDVIIQLIRRLLSMAKDLFGTEKMIRVQDHIRKLDTILKSHEMSSELYKEELEIVKEIFIKLNESSGFITECFPADISSALNLYISGRFQEGEIQPNRIGMVSPLHQVDAACIKNNSKIHVCLCDVNNMPGGKKEYIWPLTTHHITECYRRTRNPLIVNMMHVMDSAYICNRYFMYAALKNTDVQLSWIRDMGDKLLAPSPYIKLVEEAAGVKIIPAKRDSVTYKRVEQTPAGVARTKEYDIKRMPMNVTKEAKMDYAICPMKYAFGYVVEKFPTFQNEFHQNYAINGLIAAIYNLMKNKGMSVEEVYESVIKLFPAMRGVEKHQIYDYLHYQNSFTDEDIIGSSELGNRNYTEERLRVRFPNKDVRMQAFENYGRLLTPDGQTGMDFYMTASEADNNSYRSTSINVCLFCQHQNYCRYATFTVDQEELYD